MPPAAQSLWRADRRALTASSSFAPRARLQRNGVADQRGLRRVGSTGVRRGVPGKCTGGGWPSDGTAIGVCETGDSGYPDCRDDTIKALQAVNHL